MSQGFGKEEFCYNELITKSHNLFNIPEIDNLGSKAFACSLGSKALCMLLSIAYKDFSEILNLQ